jgi:hypothetical protein
MSDCKGAERPCREWWAVLGTVAEALEGLVSCGFGGGASAVDVGAADADAGAVECFLGCALKYDGGKCLALYILSTASSNYTCQHMSFRDSAAN